MFHLSIEFTASLPLPSRQIIEFDLTPLILNVKWVFKPEKGVFKPHYRKYTDVMQASSPCSKFVEVIDLSIAQT